MAEEVLPSHKQAVNTYRKHAIGQKCKYLTFTLGDDEYGLELLKVCEVIGYMDITEVPKRPKYVIGVINIKDQIIPVVDLHLRLGISEFEVADQTSIIIVKISSSNKKFQAGIIVDHVLDVLDIAKENIKDATQFKTYMSTDYIHGICKIEDSVKILLDVDKVLNGDELYTFIENQK